MLLSSTCSPHDAILNCRQNAIVAYKMVSNKNIKIYYFLDKMEKRKTYLVRDKNKHFRMSKTWCHRPDVAFLMPPSWCCLSDPAILTPPFQCHHPDATILTQLYWCHPLNTTLLMQPFSSCYPQTALLMLLSSHCHWNIIGAYKMISKNNIKRTYSFSDKLEKRKT